MNLTTENINLLFKRLFAIFPAYRTTLADPEVLAETKALWANELDRRDVDYEQIKKALQRCAESGQPFFPSIGQFITWGQPTEKDLGVPDIDATLTELCKNAHVGHTRPIWSHTIVRYLFNKIGQYRLSNSRESTVRDLLKVEHPNALQLLREGKLPTYQDENLLAGKVQQPYKPALQYAEMLKEKPLTPEDFKGDTSALCEYLGRKIGAWGAKSTIKT